MVLKGPIVAGICTTKLNIISSWLFRYNTLGGTERLLVFIYLRTGLPHSLHWSLQVELKADQASHPRDETVVSTNVQRNL